MSKLILSSLVLFVLVHVGNFASAENQSTESLNCSGSTSAPSTFVNGMCSGGNCNGNAPSSYLNIQGYCQSGVSFSATAYIPSQFIYGQCRGGMFSANLPSAYVNWNGRCSNGGNFRAQSSYVPAGFISGNCQENGSFSVFINPQSVQIQAECSESLNQEL